MYLPERMRTILNLEILGEVMTPLGLGFGLNFSPKPKRSQCSLASCIDYFLSRENLKAM